MFYTFGKVQLFLHLLFYSTCVSLEHDSVDEPNIPDNQIVVELNERLTKKVVNWGFKLTTYEVFAEDGYILKIHRLVKSENDLKAPVLIMHGIKGCSANFVVNRKGLAFYLAEKGYEVWVGSARGSAFSMKHRNLNPNKSRYWDFSFHEIGYYDLPAFLRKIKQVRGAARVHYAGYSMGTTMFLVLASTRASVVTDHVASVSLIAPVACPKHFKKIENKFKRLFTKWFLTFVRFIGRGDIFSYHKSVSLGLYNVCNSKGWLGWLCERYYRSFSRGKDQLDFVNYLDVFQFTPCGASVKSYLHFIQLADAENFQQFDYGKQENRLKYKQDVPPTYDLNKIDKKIYLLVGGEDREADKRDIKWLHERLQNSVYVSERFKHFDHRDFLYSTETQIINDTVLEVIEADDEGREPTRTRSEL